MGEREKRKIEGPPSTDSMATDPTCSEKSIPANFPGTVNEPSRFESASEFGAYKRTVRRLVKEKSAVR
jgi:hypothetical protein